MIESLLKASLLLTEKEKQNVLLKAQNASEEEKKYIENVLAQEKDLIALLFYEFSKKSPRGSFEYIKGSLASFDIALIREQEKKEMESETLPDFN